MLTYDGFLADVDDIVVNQIKRVLSRRHMPPAISEDIPSPFPRYPMLGHVAIYTLNLVILRAILSDMYEFDEAIIGAHEDGARPWDQLTHVWRSWFSMDNLNGLAAILNAERIESKVQLVPRPSFSVPISRDRLETVLNVSRAVGDNVVAGLAGLSAYCAGCENSISLDRIDAALTSENIDVRTQLSLKALLEAAADTDFGAYGKLADLATKVIEYSVESGRIDELRQAIDLISARYPLLEIRLPRLFYRAGWPKLETAGRRRSNIMTELGRLAQFHSGRFLFGNDRKVLFHMSPQDVLGMGEGFQEEIFAWADVGAAEAWKGSSHGQVMEYIIDAQHEATTAEYLDTLVDMKYAVRSKSARKGSGSEPDAVMAAIEKRGGIGELARHRPDIVLEILTIVGRSDAQMLLSQLDVQWIEPLLTPLGFRELADRRPTVAVDLLRRALGPVRPRIELSISRDQVRKLILTLVHPETIAQFVSARPAVINQLLRLLERGGSEFVDSEVSGNWHPAFIANMLRTNPDVAVALLRLFRCVHKTQDVREFGEEVFKRRTDIRRLALQDFAPAYSELLQFVREVGGEALLGRVAELLLEVYGRPGRKRAMFDRMPIGLAAELKRFAEAAGNARLMDIVVAGISEILEGRSGRERSS